MHYPSEKPIEFLVCVFLDMVLFIINQTLILSGVNESFKAPRW